MSYSASQHLLRETHQSDKTKCRAGETTTVVGIIPEETSEVSGSPRRRPQKSRRQGRVAKLPRPISRVSCPQVTGVLYTATLPIHWSRPLRPAKLKMIRRAVQQPRHSVIKTRQAVGRTPTHRKKRAACPAHLITTQTALTTEQFNGTVEH